MLSRGGSDSGERRGDERHLERLAPDDRGVQLCQVDGGGNLVVLRARIALEFAQIDEAGQLFANGRRDLGRSSEVDMQVGTVEDLEVLEAQDAAAIRQLEDFGAARAVVNDVVERALCLQDWPW